MEKMLTEAKLRDFYKCMGATCTYTTDDFQSFAQHLVEHRVSGDPTSWNRCSYCKKSFNHLENHLATEHKYCRYQCDKCFYRGAEPMYLQLHQVSFFLKILLRICHGCFFFVISNNYKFLFCRI